MSALRLPNTTITHATLVDSGTFTPEGADRPIQKLPPFCRVAGVAKPTSDSNIQFEVWMPGSGWNGKFRGVGNGGFAGAISYNAMAIALRDGYATASTDTGHHDSNNTNASWALGHPEKVVDFGYRGVHEMTQRSKAIIAAFYKQAPEHAYFEGCSDGGREALMEAQRFPGDYNGILAGAPANYWTHLLSSGIPLLQMMDDPASYIPASKIYAISQAVVNACDALDGVKDGVINEPTKCRFDPAVLLCKEADADNCLTAPQIALLKKIYAGARDSNGEQIFPGIMPGGEEGENGWKSWITGKAAGQSLYFAFSTNYFRNMVFSDPAWDFRKADLETAIQAAEEKTAHNLNATDPDLTAFKQRGGKLILYHGWNDAAIPPLNTVNYYENAVKKMGAANVASFARLYMAPGVQHCGGGPGPNSFGQAGLPPAHDAEHSVSISLEAWVEKGTAPGPIIATKYVDDRKPASGIQMTRPLCVYPKVAVYKGSGDTNDSANFVCSNE